MLKAHRSPTWNWQVNRRTGTWVVAALPLLLLLLAAAHPAAMAQELVLKRARDSAYRNRAWHVADFAARNPAATSQPLATLFSDVVRNDLDYSGILDIASKSFYPTQVPSVPAELNATACERITLR